MPDFFNLSDSSLTKSLKSAISVSTLKLCLYAIKCINSKYRSIDLENSQFFIN